jgi:hypothetical protein
MAAAIENMSSRLCSRSSLFKMGEGGIVENQENTLNSFHRIHPIPFFISCSASAYR